MDSTKVEALADRLTREVNGALSCYVLYLGHRLGLLAELAKTATTPDHLAIATGCHERYVSEWLSALVAGGYAEFDMHTGLYSLPSDHVTVLLDADDPAYSMPLLAWLPRLADVLPQLETAFRTGQGVPYATYAIDRSDVLGDGNRVDMLRNMSAWLQALPDTWQRLQNGGVVLDVGCGHGWSSIALAQALPCASIYAIDADPASLDAAQANVLAAGLDHRIQLRLADVEQLKLNEPVDLVTAFECIHDMSRPVAALARLRELLALHGSVLIVDERVSDDLTENINFLGHLNYNYSVLHCLPQAMEEEGSAATGAVMGPARLATYARAAGFAACQVLPVDHHAWRFYQLIALDQTAP